MQRGTATHFARIGYAARGVVYLLLGGLASVAALGSGGTVTDTHGVFQEIISQPFGAILLAIVAFGLFCFALWRVAQSLFDADRLGTDGKAVLRRVSCGVSAIMNGALAVSAAGIALGNAASGGGENSAHDWTATLMAAPFGRWLVGAVGLAVVGTGLALAWKAWKGDVLKHLELSAQQHWWAKFMGRAGYVARGLVFLLIGGFLVLAALHANPEEATGLTGALRVLEAQPYGWLLFALTALGLFSFGAFQLVVAAFRRIDAPDLGDLKSKIPGGVPSL